MHDTSTALVNRRKTGVFEELNPYRQKTSQNDIASSTINNGLYNNKTYV